MPELPEVETSRRGIAPWVENQEVRKWSFGTAVCDGPYHWKSIVILPGPANTVRPSPSQVPVAGYRYRQCHAAPGNVGKRSHRGCRRTGRQTRSLRHPLCQRQGASIQGPQALRLFLWAVTPETMIFCDILVRNHFRLNLMATISGPNRVGDR